jgi:hypothetical protein
MAGLRALTYTSEAKELLSRQQIDHLLASARSRNEQERVTGVLLYSNGHFLQYLEGPELGLSKIWAIIQADPLHQLIVARAYETIYIREFDQWSMAFRAMEDYGMSHPMHLDSLLSGRFSENTRSTSLAIKTLLTFWKLHKGRGGF